MGLNLYHEVPYHFTRSLSERLFLVFFKTNKIFTRSRYSWRKKNEMFQMTFTRRKWSKEKNEKNSQLNAEKKDVLNFHFNWYNDLNELDLCVFVFVSFVWLYSVQVNVYLMYKLLLWNRNDNLHPILYYFKKKETLCLLNCVVCTTKATKKLWAMMRTMYTFWLCCCIGEIKFPFNLIFENEKIIIFFSWRMCERWEKWRSRRFVDLKWRVASCL